LKSIRSGYLWFDVLVTMAIMSIYGGSVCPDVNESHYMTKAKNFWDPSFCPNDLFLNSADAHWFFFVTFGLATKFTSLPIATWIGRLVCWFALSYGWCRFATLLAPIRLVGCSSVLLLLASIHWGQLAGEWVVGGCEAKCMAYAFSFLGLTAAARRDWPWTLVHFGIACAFHILTGGWIALALVLAVITRAIAKRFFPKWFGSDSNDTFVKRSQGYKLACVLVGAMFFAVGLVPALALNFGVDTATTEMGAMIYVFARLPHHLRVYGFSNERWESHALLIFITMATAWIAWFILRYGKEIRTSEQPDSLAPDYQLILMTCGVGVVFALIGTVIDVSLSSWAVNWSANWLRYYWFRWNDVAWPVALCTLVLASTYRLSRMSYQQSWRLAAQLFCWTILLVPGGMLCTQRWYEFQSRDNIPPADDRSLIFANTTQAVRQRTYDDWRNACQWIRTETPADSLWLTPRNQQTFKWNAQRAEVVCWKDSPQNATDLVEWNRRVDAVFPRNELGGPVPLNQTRAIDLYRQFNFDYILMDLRVDPQPLTLPIVFRNDTFAVFQMKPE
jgi:hypothetical protein